MSQPITIPFRRIGTFLAVCAFLALAAAGSSFGAGSMDWKVKIAPAAAISGDRVMLGDIAQPVGEMDPETWRILAATPLWPFPGREGQLLLTRKKILDDLDKLFPNSEGNFHVPAQVLLKKGGGTPVAVSEVDKMIVDYLTANMTGQEGELEVKDITLPGQLFVDNELERLSIESVGNLVPGRVNLRLTISTLDGRVLRQIAANAFVNMWKVIPVASRPLNLREGTLTSDKVTFERRNMAYVRGVPWDSKDSVPMRVKGSINQGTPLTSETVEPMPAILKGD
jgi:flagellar basal body P-ring formation protein FlgA